MTITCTILENGNLQLVADDAESLADEYESRGFWSAFCDGMESYSCNGSFTPFDAGNANPFVGLSSAPCIAESMSIDDDGAQTIDGRFWFFADYMITCPIKKLINGESVVFTLAGEV